MVVLGGQVVRGLAKHYVVSDWGWFGEVVAQGVGREDAGVLEVGGGLVEVRVVRGEAKDQSLHGYCIEVGGEDACNTSDVGDIGVVWSDRGVGLVLCHGGKVCWSHSPFFGAGQLVGTVAAGVRVRGNDGLELVLEGTVEEETRVELPFEGTGCDQGMYHSTHIVCPGDVAGSYCNSHASYALRRGFVELWGRVC